MTCRPVLAAALLACAAAVSAQDAAPIPEGRPPEWSLSAGYGFSFKVNRGRSEEHLFLFEPGVSFRLGSRFEWVAEGHLARYFSPEGYMVGVVPAGVRFYVGSGRVLPYAMVGVGFGWTDLTELDEIDRRFNFLVEGAAGVRGALPNGQAWTLEWRWSHVSNANTALPNLGLNCSVFLAGWRF